MSRGPGRLQRRILEVLAEVPEREGCRRGEVRTRAVAHKLADEWWWDETFTRQVRRALDSLHAAGRVEKRLLPNPERPRMHGTSTRGAFVALWRLPDPGNVSVLSLASRTSDSEG